MKQNERELLIEIDHLYTDLLAEQNGYYYKHNADVLKHKVFELYHRFNPEYLSYDTVYSLDHTCRKEVNYVVSNYENTVRNESSKRSKVKYINFRDEANLQIGVDLIHLFGEIKTKKASLNQQ